MQLDCVDIEVRLIATLSARALKLLASLKFLLCTSKGNKLIHLCNEHLTQVLPVKYDTSMLSLDPLYGTKMCTLLTTIVNTVRY